VRLEGRRAEHEAEAVDRCRELAEAAAFDPGDELERLHRFQSARHRELVRTVELHRKDPPPEPEPSPDGAGSYQELEATDRFVGGGSARRPMVQPGDVESSGDREAPPIGPNEAAPEKSEILVSSGIASIAADAQGDERSRIEPSAAAPVAGRRDVRDWGAASHPGHGMTRMFATASVARSRCLDEESSAGEKINAIR
jgi:hypothetical protein